MGGILSPGVCPYKILVLMYYIVFPYNFVQVWSTCSVSRFSFGVVQLSLFSPFEENLHVGVMNGQASQRISTWRLERWPRHVGSLAAVLRFSLKQIWTSFYVALPFMVSDSHLLELKTLTWGENMLMWNFQHDLISYFIFPIPQNL